MIPSLPQNPLLRTPTAPMSALFFVFLAAPLVVVAVFAFNDSLFPALPWRASPRLVLRRHRAARRPVPRRGAAQGDRCLGHRRICGDGAVGAVGTANAFLFERRAFRFRNLAYILMLAPLVIPGVILGISILVFASGVANRVDDASGVELESCARDCRWWCSASSPSSPRSRRW